MAKRRLTKRQISRIAAKQQQNQSSTTDIDDDTHFEAEQTGFVVAHFGTQVLVQSTANALVQQRAHFRANTPNLVVGDKVRWQAGVDTGVVNSRLDRKNKLERPDFRGTPKTVAANIDKLFIIVAPEPPTYSNLIDRYIVACHYHDMTPVIVLNKVDLAPEKVNPCREIVAVYRDLGYQVIELSTKSGCGMQELKASMKDTNVMLAGQSGVGKSSLTNILAPNANTIVGELSHAAAKGKHTTTASHWFALDNGGGLIDSPGIREFSLNHLSPDDILRGFTECVAHYGQCQFRDCNHLNAKGCAILANATAGNITENRLSSFHLLIKECNNT